MKRPVRIGVTGATGLAGHAVIEQAFEAGIEAVAITRGMLDFSKPFAHRPPFAVMDSWLRDLGLSAVINCAGLTPHAVIGEASYESWRCVNAEAPRLLAQACARLDMRFVHLSTDCVFKQGWVARTEADIPDLGHEDDQDVTLAQQWYGVSKALGESGVLAVNPKAVVVRTSFVGASSRGLWAWAVRQVLDDKMVPLWWGTKWTGLTATEVARRLLLLAMQPAPYGVLHLHTERVQTKGLVVSNILAASGLALQLGKRWAVRDLYASSPPGRVLASSRSEDFPVLLPPVAGDVADYEAARYARLIGPWVKTR